MLHYLNHLRPSHRRFAVEALIIFLIALAFSFWSSGWILDEEFFAVDDAVKERLFVQTDQALQEDGLLAAYRTLMPADENNYGPTFIVGGYLLYKISPERSVAIHHLFRIFSRAIFISFLWGTTRLLGGGFTGASFTVLIGYFLAAPTIIPDMQTYTANWWRLYTTDGAGATGVAGFWFFATLAIGIGHTRFRGWKLYTLLAASIASLLLALMAKMTFLYLAPTIICAAILGALFRIYRPGYRRLLLYFAAALAACLPMFSLYSVGGGEITVKRYESASLFSPEQITHGLYFYFSILMESGFLLLPFALLAGAVFFFHILFRSRRLPIRARLRRLVAFSALIAGLGGMVLQSAWPILLPRYMLSFVPPLAIAFGVFIGWAWRALPRKTLFPGLPRWVEHAPGFLIYLLGFAALYAPIYRGGLKLTAFVLLALLIPATAFLFLRHRRLAPYAAQLLRGVLIGAVFCQAIVLFQAYRESRTAFRTWYKGYNLVKDQLRQLDPPEDDINLWSNYGSSEIIGNNRWLLNYYEGWNLEGAILSRQSEIDPPALVHIAYYPHPPSGQYMTPGRGEHRYTGSYFSTMEGKSNVRKLAGPEDPPRTIPFETGSEPVKIGRAQVRLATETMPWHIEFHLEIIDPKNDEILGEAVFPGVETPRQKTDWVPMEFVPPVELQPNRRYLVRARSTVSEHANLLTFFQRQASKPLFITYKPDGGEERIGLRLDAAEQWIDAPPTKVMSNRYGELTWHMDSPWQIIRRIIKRRGDGQNLNLLTLQRYHMTSTLAAWTEE